jgi:hypothetical protein
MSEAQVVAIQARQLPANPVSRRIFGAAGLLGVTGLVNRHCRTLETALSRGA